MKDFMKDYGVVMFSTTELIVTIVAFIFLGRYLDTRFDLHQKALITCAVVGSVLAFLRFALRLQKINNEQS